MRTLQEVTTPVWTCGLSVVALTCRLTVRRHRTPPHTCVVIDLSSGNDGAYERVSINAALAQQQQQYSPYGQAPALLANEAAYTRFAGLSPYGRPPADLSDYSRAPLYAATGAAAGAAASGAQYDVYSAPPVCLPAAHSSESSDRTAGSGAPPTQWGDASGVDAYERVSKQAAVAAADAAGVNDAVVLVEGAANAAASAGDFSPYQRVSGAQRGAAGRSGGATQPVSVAVEHRCGCHCVSVAFSFAHLFVLGKVAGTQTGSKQGASCSCSLETKVRRVCVCVCVCVFHLLRDLFVIFSSLRRVRAVGHELKRRSIYCAHEAVISSCAIAKPVRLTSVLFAFAHHQYAAFTHLLASPLFFRAHCCKHSEKKQIPTLCSPCRAKRRHTKSSITLSTIVRGRVTRLVTLATRCSPH